MKCLPIRFFFAGLACLTIAGAQSHPNVSRSEPKYHYAFRRLIENGSETQIENWDGSINWDSHPKRDELWVQKDGKNFLITDKATLDAFENDFKPLRDFNGQRTNYMDGYYKARGEERGYERSGRSLDRQISNLHRRIDRAKSDDEKSDIDKEISDLQKEKDSLGSKQKDAQKKLDAETKKREEFYTRREEIRAQVYKKTDKLIDEAFAKGLPHPGNP